MYGIYINCRRQHFVDWILSGAKQDETRPRDVLRALVGQRVWLIETGLGAPVVRGSALVESSRRVPYADEAARRAAGIHGTPYDIPRGGEKGFYHLADVRPVAPFPVPAARINHGRSYTEF